MLQSIPQSQTSVFSDKVIPAACAALLGLSIIFSVAFMQGPNASVHDAAHDMRHSFGVVCH